MRLAAIGILYLSTALLAPVLALASQAPAVGQPVLVVGPTWDGRLEVAVTRSGGRTISLSPAPFAVLAVSDEASFTDNVQEAGAWFVFDGRTIAAICGYSA